MPRTFTDQFYLIDPFSPPPRNTFLSFVTYTLVDQDDDGTIEAGSGDTINGSLILNAYVGDTVTVRVQGSGTITYTGVTFYLANGDRVFTPIDGQILQNGRFRDASYVTTEAPVQVPQDIGPPCFTPGAMILTPDGERPVESLEAGDLVVTRDRDPQPVVWTGAETWPGTGEKAPVLIRAGAMGNRRDLIVSPQHRMLVRGWRAELLAGQPEVLVAALHLVNGRTILRAPCETVTYVHFMLARHEIVFAEGAETESLDPWGRAAAADRAILRLAADRSAGGRARPAVRGWEGRALAL